MSRKTSSTKAYTKVHLELRQRHQFQYQNFQITFDRDPCQSRCRMCVLFCEGHWCSGYLTAVVDGEPVHFDCRKLACDHYAGGRPINNGMPRLLWRDLCKDRNVGLPCTERRAWAYPPLSHRGARDWAMYMCTICYAIKGPDLSTQNYE